MKNYRETELTLRWSQRLFAILSLVSLIFINWYVALLLLLLSINSYRLITVMYKREALRLKKVSDEAEEIYCGFNRKGRRALDKKFKK